jgi:hypothetical protein
LQDVSATVSGKFWHREKGNIVQLNFSRPDAAKVSEAFSSPTSADKSDPQLVEAFRSMGVGDALEFGRDAVGNNNPRSVKITVGKAAKEAGWKLAYRNISTEPKLGFYAKIVAPATSGNGNDVETSVDASEEPTNGTTEEVASTGRSRRS